MRGCDGRRVTRGIRFGLQSAGAPWRWPGIFGRLRACQSQQIAERLGRSPATVKAYFSDPTGEKARAVTARYIDVLLRLRRRRGETVGNSPGSKWTAFNAIAEHLDYGRRYTSRTNQVQRSFEDTSVKQRALESVLGRLNSEPSGTSVNSWAPDTRPGAQLYFSLELPAEACESPLLPRRRKGASSSVFSRSRGRSSTRDSDRGWSRTETDARGGSGRRPVMRSAR